MSANRIINVDDGIVTRIEELNEHSLSKSKEFFASIDNKFNSLTSNIQDESYRNQLELIKAREISERGFSETNQNLIRISQNFADLNASVLHSTNSIVQSVKTLSSDVLKKMTEQQFIVEQTNRKMEAINGHLKDMHSEIQTISKMYEFGNETRALEIADHARQHICLDELDKASQRIEEAFRYCGVSVTVHFYNILVLSHACKNEENIEKIIKAFDSCIKLIDLKLNNKSGLRPIQEEITSSVYIAICAFNTFTANKYLDKIDKLLLTISNNPEIYSELLSLPLRDKTTAALVAANPLLKDLLWARAVNFKILKQNDYAYLQQFLKVLHTDDTPIKNELLLTCCRHAVKNAYFDTLIEKHWADQRLNKLESVIVDTVLLFSLKEIQISFSKALMINDYLQNTKVEVHPDYVSAIRDKLNLMEVDASEKFIPFCESVHSRFLTCQERIADEAVREIKETIIRVNRETIEHEKDVNSKQSQVDRLKTSIVENEKVRTKLKDKSYSNADRGKEMAAAIVVLSILLALGFNDGDFNVWNYLSFIPLSILSSMLVGLAYNFLIEPIRDKLDDNRRLSIRHIDSEIQNDKREIDSLQTSISADKNNIQIKRIGKHKIHLDKYCTRVKEDLNHLKKELYDKKDAFFNYYYPSGTLEVRSTIEFEKQFQFSRYEKLPLNKEQIKRIDDELTTLSSGLVHITLHNKLANVDLR